MSLNNDWKLLLQDVYKKCVDVLELFKLIHFFLDSTLNK